jgi:molybdopterin converting factor small subunit
MITVLIPTALRSFTERQGAVQLEAGTVGQAVAALAENYPDLKQHLYDDQGQLRSFVNLFVGGRNVKTLEGLATPLAEGETLTLVPAIAGGRDA